MTPPAAGGSPPPPPAGGAGGAPPSDAAGKGPSKAEQLADRAKRAHDKGKEIRDRIDELTPEDDESEEPRDDEADEVDEASSPSEPVTVDYSDTWDRDPPPPPQRAVVVTHVVHQPARLSPPVPEEPPPTPEPRVHGFIGVTSRGTTANYNPSILMGARAGFTFRDRFTIGGAFHSLTARYGGPIVDPHGRALGLRMTYGGVLLGWRLYSGRVVQLDVQTMAGAGAACIARGKKSVGPARCLEKVGLVAIEPGVELAFVVTDWARLGLAGGYRFVTREAWRPPNDFTLSGPYLGLGLDFGRFRARR